VRFASGAVAAGVATLALAPPALANGRFPSANEIFFAPASPSFVGVRTTFGILLSYDGGSTWSWLCEDTLGLGPKTTEDPPIAMTAGGSMVAALSFGLDVSTDQGCSWSFAGGPLASQVFKDVALRPDSPHGVVAVTATYSSTAGEGGAPGYEQQVYESTDDGANWAPLGSPIDPSVLVTTIDVAPSDPMRLYASAIRHTTTPPTASLFVSTDAGASWVERPLPFDATRSTAVFVAGVDPTNADLVYVRSDGKSQLFVTPDAGKTWSVPLSIDDPMLGFALSSDGSSVYAGSFAAGLFAASRASAGPPSFASISSIHVECLATHGADLWACSDEPSGFVVGQSASAGASFAPRLANLLAIGGPLACAPGAGASVCTSFDFDASPPYDPFTALCTNLSACEEDAGRPPLTVACSDAGQCPVVATAPSTGGQSSCGCAAAGEAEAGSGVLALGVFFASAAARARRRRAR
jgi:MYXO-CTERM domain-containing protein